MSDNTIMVVSDDDMSNLYYTAKSETGFVKQYGKRTVNKKVRVDYNGCSINLGSIRQQVFMEKSHTCCDCGICGNEWHVDNESNGLVLNLYHVDDNGNETLMSHMKIDKNKGDSVDNSEVICSDCLRKRHQQNLY